MRGYVVGSLLAVALGAGPASAGSLEISVTNVAPGEGRVFVTAYSADDTFPEPDTAFGRIQHRALRETVTLTIQNLPAGDYAVAAFQDVEGTGELETGLMGAPQEPSGFSEGATGTMGPPDFSDAAVSVPENGTTATEVPLQE